ncbi:MAG: hypothetical protein E7189_01995 [Erysipelotrichaceae bacterium]|nr:hypothetical protein [Erysipelotrichaceae bacterium]
MEWIYKLYHKVEHNPLVKQAVKVYRKGNPIENKKALKRLKALSQKKASGKTAKVVFIGQSTTCWNKLKSVCDEMIKDSRFDVKVLAVPDDVCKSNSGVYDYFYNIYGDLTIKADEGNGWFDLKAYSPDYVIYQRPYDRYLPKEYQSAIVADYAKTVYVPYGFIFLAGVDEVIMPHLFYRNMYMFFCESKVTYDFNCARYKSEIELGYKKGYNIGYPSLEDFLREKEKYKVEDDDYFRVLWTPRWSDDKELGGSSFMENKDNVVKLIDESEDIKLIFRPHPMTFNYFIEKGSLTKEEADEYIKKYEENDRLEYDKSPYYVKTLWENDVLFTDTSSIIAEYYLSDKPIVFYETGGSSSEFFNELKKGMYCVDKWEDAKKVLLDLRAGVDPLKDVRRKIKEEMFGKNNENIAKKYLEVIYEDYTN